MVAEHGDGAIAEVGDETQNLERARTAVDEIAGKPEPIAPAIEVDVAQQRTQLRVAACTSPIT